MKKQICIKFLAVFTLVLMLSITTIITAFAESSTSAYVSSGTEVSRGEEITISVGISNGSEIQSILIIPEYDSDTFDLVDGGWTLSGGIMSDFSVSSGDGVILFNPGINVDGKVLTFTLKAKNDAAFDTYSISAEVVITDSNGNTTLTTTPATVQVRCDHSFTKEDTTYLKSAATCTNPAIYYKSCVTCGEKGIETFNYGSTIEHSYTRKVTTDAYKVSGATCTAKAVYNYCCATCDKAGTTTYEDGTTLSHSYTREVITDDYKVSDADCDSKAVYNYCCTTCDEKGITNFEHGEVLGHTGGTATCTAKAICTRCTQAYGEMLEHVYTDEDVAETYLKAEATCTSEAVYYKNCATCDKAGTATFEYGSPEPHSYTRKVTTDTYKKSSATCTVQAVYYYCCATCDAKGTTTYEDEKPLTHNYTREVITDTYKVSDADCDSKAVYNYCCATCDEKGTTTFEYGEVLGHTGGTATCTAKAICTRCSQEYGDTLDHIYDQEVVQDKYLASAASCTAKEKYYKSCTCGAKGSVTFEVGDKRPHDYMEKVDALYLKDAATCTTKAVYYESCSVCGEKGTATFETGDAPSHSYRTNWSSDSTSHWHECSKCGDKKDSASHTEGAAATEYTAQTCTVCEYVITPALGHTHHYNTTWSNDADNHWYACSGCSEPKDKSAHIYKNACDTDCDVCGYTREITHNYNTDWANDAEKHWYECTICGDKKNETVHTPGADATETTDQTCTVCGYVIKEALGHTHNHSTIKNDETNHWNECACGDKTDVAAHTWDDGVVTKEATYDEEGEKTFTCSTCSCTKIESIEKLIREEDTTTDTDVDTDVNTDTPVGTDVDTDSVEQPSGGCRSAIGVSAASIVVIAIALGAVVFVKKKKA